MKIINIVPIKLITEPTEEIMFHFEKKSGLSEYRRGIPLNPKKCCGKKVIFTPMKVIKNCLFVKTELKFRPKNNGNQ